MGNYQNKNNDATSRRLDLNDTEIELLSKTTGEKRHTIREWHEQFLAEYPTGCINREQFALIFKRIHRRGQPEKFSQFAFAAFASDHNKKYHNKISFSDFILATAFLQPKCGLDEQEKRLALSFDVFDV
jgi:Ca2+-binding EF-hand superfamily protein